jgi:two-component system, response regulator FlrC
VRELDNLLQRALILVNGPVIRQEHIQFELANESGGQEPVVLRIGTAGATTGSGVRPGAPAAAGASPSYGTGHGTSPDSAGSLANSLGQTERDLILNALRTGEGSRREAAEKLGISQRTLRYKLAKLREAGIDVPAA